MPLTRAELATAIALLLADNITGDITPADIRSIATDIVAAVPNTEDNDGFPIASAIALGVVKVGSGITVDANGVISIPAEEPPVAAGVAYLAGDASKWSGSPPSNVADALDRIAAQIGPIA